MKLRIQKLLIVLATAFAACCGSSSGGESTTVVLDERFPSNWNGAVDAPSSGSSLEDVL